MPNSPFGGGKRVRFAPQSSEIASIVGSDANLRELVSGERDVMRILKNDLEASLQRLKADSAKILNESFSDSESWSTGIGYDDDDIVFFFSNAGEGFDGFEACDLLLR